MKYGIVQGGDPLSKDPAKVKLYGTGGLGVLKMESSSEKASAGAVAAVLQPGRPDSAGAQPGPACYGRGGEMPTITDCNLVMGHLSEDNFLGGRMRLDAKAAHRAVESKVAAALKMDVAAAA